MPKRKLDLKEILVPALSLFVICLVTAGAVAGVNEITKNTQDDAYAAQREIFPGATFEDSGAYLTAWKDGMLLGYCVDAGAQGYGGLIEVTVGLDTQGGIVKVQVVNCGGETPGLGTKVNGEGFLAQFLGKQEAVQVDAITGATYSSKGVADAVNQALQIYEEQIRGGEAQ